MAHYVKVVDGTVVNGIVAEPEFFDTFVDSSPGEWIKTSYNVRGGVYYDPTTGEPHADQAEMIAADEGRQRKNYAGIGYTFDAARDAFIPPRPYASWILDEQTCLWNAPVAMPEDAGTGDPPKRYQWDEVTTNWKAIEE